MRKLIICDTLYQIMLGIQMKMTLFKNDSVDIWISDHSEGAYSIAKRLEAKHIFHKVVYYENKKIIYSKGIYTKLKNIFIYGFGRNLENDLDNYDEVLFYSMSIIIYGISYIYEKRRHEAIWSRYEEGILSYETDFENGNSVFYLEIIFRILGKKIVKNTIKRYYCVFPKLKKTNLQWELIKIPRFDNNAEELRSLFAEIFGYKQLYFKQKYIYFASSSDIDGKPYGETELIFKLADIVGKDNLIIKKHPRDDRKIYRDNGFEELDSEGIPWEVFQICSNISDKVLLTVDSGSFLSISAINKSSVKGFFLFPCLEEKRKNFMDRDKVIRDILNELHKHNVCKEIRIVNRIDDVLCEEE